MTGNTVVTTEYSTISNIDSSFDTTLSDHGDERKEEHDIVCGDFVPPPSCWFDSSPIVDESNVQQGNPVTIDDSGILSDLPDGVTEASPSPDSSNLIPVVTGTVTANSNDGCIEDSNATTKATSPKRAKKVDNQDDECSLGQSSQQQQQQQQNVAFQASAGALPIQPETVVVRAAPSWKEISSQVLPAAAKELLSSSVRRLYYTAKLSYAKGRWHRKYSDMGQTAGGFSIEASSNLELPQHLSELPPFSNLSWIDRQLVREWRTYLPETHEESEDFEFEQARTLVPKTIPRPVWKNADVCHTCHKPFGPVRLRHHCRSCGQSFCHDHSSSTHGLPHLGYEDVPERVCDSCKRILEDQNLTERIAWRLARCRDYNSNSLTPYFETGVDSVEEVALRVAQAAIRMAKSVPLGAQATVAVETVDVLRKYGLHGIYGIMLRQEFLQAADLLRKALGINKTSWPLSVHELTAAIFYALAQHRAMRGVSPDREEKIHEFRSAPVDEDFGTFDSCEPDGTPTAAQLQTIGKESQKIPRSRSFTPVCDPVPDMVLGSLLFYAPIALNFIYATKEVEMQLLAAQQGWRLLYAFLHQDTDSVRPCDRPASAIFLHQEHKIVCLSIRGTATINDVITDIRQTPVPFPSNLEKNDDDDWTTIDRGKGLALCGMASAASNLFYEHIDSIMTFVNQGYKIRIVGHSLGGGVATMIGVLVLRHLEQLGYSNDAKGTALEKLLKVYAYGTPSCFDSKLSDSVDDFVTTVVLHDDVFPRLTPTSCRGLLKHLLYIRETWVKAHMEDDLRAVGERAKTAWAPRIRRNFALRSSTSSIKKYCKKQILRGSFKLTSPKSNTQNESPSEEVVSITQNVRKSEKDEFCDCTEIESITSDPTEWGEKFFVPTTQSVICGEEKADESFDTNMNETDDCQPQLLVEFLGGGDNEREGIIIDGDEFFETEDNLVGENDEESVGDEFFSDAIGELEDETSIQMSDSWSIDMHKSEVSPSKNNPSMEEDEEPDVTAVVLDESPLPKMFLPGKVVHIYSHRGVYKAAYVPRTFTELRRISMAGNMLSNHTTKSYFESLLEVQTCRAASESPPRWTAYDEDDTCCCCANRFTWASTSNSEAQEARDKHNCRSCGGLICDPCSKNRVPIPSIGLTVPVRVCDRCYNDIKGGVSAAVSSSVAYVLAAKKGDATERNSSSIAPHEEKKKPERTRQKRSAVVDDLVSRMHNL
mmetsp:Transcript_22267/g.55140  ORF Transcript_22267/g.55140 Transcript_22267/m.55140 type:complete len:1218 (-) Transcript_22267:241-3894(-)